jgi:hypothetical protein
LAEKKEEFVRNLEYIPDFIGSFALYLTSESAGCEPLAKNGDINKLTRFLKLLPISA